MSGDAARLRGAGGGAPPASRDRSVYPNNESANAQFVDNVIVTSKYTAVNFLPVFLLEQFMRMANAYFLFVCILQSIPVISITSGVPTSFLPLSLVLLFDGIVTAREDYKRHKDDDRANRSLTLTLRGGRFRLTAWADIRVGDVLRIERNAPVPADCVFLSSVTADGGLEGADSCYVQTAQLDGETNLKLKVALPATAARFRTDADAASFHGRVVCEAPNAAFDKFVGLLHLEAGATAVSGSSSGLGAAAEAARRPLPLEADQLLLRGSMLRNVDAVYALVVYTGKETKVRVRQTTAPSKRAAVEGELNRLILVLIALLLLFCIASTTGFGILSPRIYTTDWYFGPVRRGVPPESVIAQFFTFFLLNAALIPISLYVTVRLARSLQMIFMERDEEMVHEDAAQLAASGGAEGVYPFKVRTMDLNDELGGITHIFSDKTGTLTLNYMEWRKLIVGGVSYGLGTTQIGIDRLQREGKSVAHLEEALASEKLRGSERGAQLPHVNFEDGSETHPGRTLGSDGRNPCDGGQGGAIHDMLLHLALNQTVVPEVVRDTAGVFIGTRLSASSPDEEAFCYASETLGYKFNARSHEGVVLALRMPPHLLPFRRATAPLSPAARAAGAAMLASARRGASEAAAAAAAASPSGKVKNSPGTEVAFRILCVLGYTQERKRMSVIVEHPMLDTDGTAVATGGCASHSGGGSSSSRLPPSECGDVYLYCKGADSTILPRCADPRTPSEVEALQRTQAVMSEWGNDGLRTLCFACKKLPREAYLVWSERYTAACSDLDELRKKKDKRPNAIEDLQSELEAGLTLQGATANEDKLQPEVPETIATLARAGIKLWMVTGDKQETAVNIGFACRLLDETQRQVVATMEAAGGVNAAMKRLRLAAKRMRAERKADAAAHADVAAHGGPGGVSSVLNWATQQIDLLEGVSSRRRGGGASKRSQRSIREETDIDIDAVALANAGAMSPASKRGVSGGGTTAPFFSLIQSWRQDGTPKGESGGVGAPSVGGAPVTHPPPAGCTPNSTVSPLMGVVVSPGGGAAAAASGAVLPRPRMGSFESDQGEEEEAWQGGEGDRVPLASPQQQQQVDVSSVVSGNPFHRVSRDTAAAGSSGDGGSMSPPRSPVNGGGGALPVALRSLPVAPLLGVARRPFALVIDEHCLDAALAHPRAKAYLLYVAVNCNAVIACRARPDQKAQVVRLIRGGIPTARTLAVGDGANDVDMITTAHVGVGIAGAEGVQAANASDYAIGRFRFLQRLLLVHGRWNYNRMTRLVLYMFWKNIVFVLAQFPFQWFNSFSGQKWYVEYGAQTFNLIFTGLPTLLLAVLDTDVDARWALRFPKLYDPGRLALGLRLSVFGVWVLDAVSCALFISFVTMNSSLSPDFSYGRSRSGASLEGEGGSPYIFQLGTVAFTSVIIVVSLRIAAEMNSHSLLFQAVLAISAILWVPSCYIFDALDQDGMGGGMRHVFGSLNAWCVILLTSGALGVRMAAWKSLKRWVRPELRHVVQEVAVITRDSKSVERYTEAADLARRTGKPLSEVLEAARITSAASETLAPIAAAAGVLGTLRRMGGGDGGTGTSLDVHVRAYTSTTPVASGGSGGGGEYSTLDASGGRESGSNNAVSGGGGGGSNGGALRISTGGWGNGSGGVGAGSEPWTPNTRSAVVEKTARVLLAGAVLPPLPHRSVTGAILYDRDADFDRDEEDAEEQRGGGGGGGGIPGEVVSLPADTPRAVLEGGSGFSSSSRVPPVAVVVTAGAAGSGSGHTPLLQRITDSFSSPPPPPPPLASAAEGDGEALVGLRRRLEDDLRRAASH